MNKLMFIFTFCTASALMANTEVSLVINPEPAEETCCCPEATEIRCPETGKRLKLVNGVYVCVEETDASETEI